MFPLALMQPRYESGVVWLSFLIAVLASYVALDLARRVRGPDRVSATTWMVGGALVFGSGIWSMHFVGMMAFVLPIELGYAAGLTALSWLAAVAVSGLALWIAARERLTPAGLSLGALAMGGGICVMHYVGMAAIDLAPGIVWNPPLVATSAVIAVVASAAALLIFFGMRRLRGWRARSAQAAAALVMGAAICGMHYTGMAAAGFPEGAVCLSADALGGRGLGTLLVVGVTVLLSITLFTSVLDARLQARAVRLARSLEATNDKLQQANDALQRLAYSDALTGLPNRSLFDDRLRQALARRARDRQLAGTRAATLAVLHLDLDGFKPVNDSWGHALGDQLLRQVAARLQQACRESDTLARLGGDEFVLLLDGVADRAEALAAAQRLVATVAGAFELEDRPLQVTCSAGVAVLDERVEPARLSAMADAAMHAAKRAGGGRALAYEAHMPLGSDPIELLQDLRQAVAGGQLMLHYQPKVDGASGRVRSVEALLRWRHPTRGLVPPAQFIGLAERNGLIVSIGHWVIDEACRQVAAWCGQGRRLRVAVNLSAWQLRQPDLVAHIEAALLRHGVDPRLLVCEITETAVMEDLLAVQRVIDALERLGVEVSLDDFGTGQSSLAMLRNLRIHELKIDRLFVHDVAHDARARGLVELVVRLAHLLGMRVVAEGVESQDQRDVLAALGCDELQGFYFARPMAPADLSAAELPAAEGGTVLAFSPSVLPTAAAAAV